MSRHDELVDRLLYQISECLPLSEMSPGAVLDWIHNPEALRGVLRAFVEKLRQEADAGTQSSLV